MKILLVACNAKYIHSNLAVYDLQAYASDYADHIVLKEYTINQQKDDIMRDIYLEHPDVVCVSCYIWNLSFVKELMADLIKILPGADFWAGGPEVSYDAEKFLTENSEFKGVMVGEGEETFKELAGYYVEKNPQNLKDMTGICYRDGDQIIHNGWRQIMDLSSIPFIYKDLSEFKNRIIYYESSRGCPFSCSYCLSSIDKKLRFRDTHFRGVCTVVGKLFNIVMPNRAYFGQKDAQQLATIKRFVRDLNFNIEIVPCPIVREEDGLAKSSRNTYLSDEERKAALILSKSLAKGREAIENGEREAKKVIEIITKSLQSEPLARIDYVEAVDFENVQRIEMLKGEVLVAIAVYIGKTRLIDNFIVKL